MGCYLTKQNKKPKQIDAAFQATLWNMQLGQENRKGANLYSFVNL